MTITSDLDDIIKKTNQNSEFQNNKKELNEINKYKDNIPDTENTIHQHNTSFNYTTNDKNNNLEFTQQDSEERKIETSETIKNYDNEE